MGHAVVQFVEALPKVAGSIPEGVIGILYWHIIFRPRYCPGVDSASNRNEHQVYFLRVKVAVA